MIKGKYILGNDDISVPVSIRKEVFSDEFKLCGFSESPTDNYAVFCVVYFERQPVASSRIYFDGEKFVIDCLCVKKEWRNKKIGDFLLRISLLKASEFTGVIYTYALADSSGFFLRYGFEDCQKDGFIGKIPVKQLKIDRSKIVFLNGCTSCKSCKKCADGAMNDKI